MNRTTAALASLLVIVFATACSGGSEAADEPVVPTVDAAGDGGGPAHEAGSVAVTPEASAPEAAASVDAGTSVDAAREAATATPDAGLGADTAAEARAEAGKPDAAPTVADAAPEARPLDAANDGGTGLPNIDRMIALVKQTWSGVPCTEGATSCGGISQDGQVLTVPLKCFDRSWTPAGHLSGGVYGGSWIAEHDCSRGCTVYQLCAP